ncbi:MAG: hypothetical protein O3A38_03695 [Proteobacteria bacterium]|nr:hypothetical protein [Pseudomonadota bacterium]
METPESMDPRSREAATACRDLLGSQAIGWEDPGGQHRKSTRLFLGDRSVIATLRDSAERADLEAGVLRSLHAQAAAVPEVLAFDGRWLIQEDIAGERLSRALRRVGKEEAFALQDRALASLDAIHDAGRRPALQHVASASAAVRSGSRVWRPRPASWGPSSASPPLHSTRMRQRAS